MRNFSNVLNQNLLFILRIFFICNQEIITKNNKSSNIIIFINDLLK